MARELDNMARLHRWQAEARLARERKAVFDTMEKGKCREVREG